MMTFITHSENDIRQLKKDLQPEKVLKQFILRMTTSLTKYDEDHPHQQDKSAQMCLEDFYRLLPNFDLYPTDSQNALKSYHEITGFLLTYYPNKDQEFNKALETIFAEEVVDSDESKNAFTSFLHDKNLQKMTNEMMIQRQKNTYQHARNTFAMNLNKLSGMIECQNDDQAKNVLQNVCKKGNNLLTRIDHLYNTKKSENDFDTKYFTNVLKSANTGLEYPTKRNVDHLKKLSSYNHSGSEVPDRIFGGLLHMFAGAILIATGILVGVVTKFTNPSAYLTIAGGVGFVGFGLGLFKSGLQKGLAKKLTQYHSALEKEQIAEEKSQMKVLTHA